MLARYERHPKRKRRKRRPVTICVAARAQYEVKGDYHPIITIAADRMITNRQKQEYELRDQTKLIWLDTIRANATTPGLHAEQVAVLMAGQVDSLMEITVSAGKRIGDEEVTAVHDMVGILVDEFHRFRRDMVERLYLKKYNLTIDKFIGDQRKFDRTFFEKIESQIDDPETDIGDLLVAGMDNDGAHIYTIHDPGIDVPASGTGFAAIGIGEDEAETVFTSATYTPFFDWLEAITLTYYAKKAAERSPGVGPNTDLWYITMGGNRYMPPLSNTVLRLSGMHEKRNEERRAALIEDAGMLAGILLEGQDAETEAVKPEPGEEQEWKNPLDEEGLSGSTKADEPKG